MVALLVLVLLLIFMLARIAYRGSSLSNHEFFSTLPTNADAYEMARQFVKPTVLGSDVKFAEDRYQFGKTSDSVYVIRSYFQAVDKSDTVKNYFKITMRYKGGATLNKMNWVVLSLEK